MNKYQKRLDSLIMQTACGVIGFVIDNGLTLCRKCHDKTKRKNYAEA